MASGTSESGDQPHHEYTTQEIGQMLFDMQIRAANTDKKMMSHKFEQENFARQQGIINKNLDETLAKLTATITQNHDRPPDPTVQQQPARGWKIPPSLTIKPMNYDPEMLPRLKGDPPRLNGEFAIDWIRKIQKFYNHTYTPLADRLYLTSFLFDPPASDWMTYWEDNNPDKGWDEFLVAVKQRYDPDLYEDYVGRLATLRQTTTVEDYQTSFEALLQKTSRVGDDTLTSLFIAGLKESIKQELLTHRPSTLQEAFAYAQQVAACQTLTAAQPKATWQTKATRSGNTFTPQLGNRNPNPRQEPTGPRNGREQQQHQNFPIVRVSAAERADRTKRGLCWYCDEAWSRAHVCSKRFYALMGTDELGDPEEQIESDDEAESMLISGDVSTIHVIGPKLRPRSIRLKGAINNASVSVLIDGGSTHNFIKPNVAEQLCLPLHTITPFRVFVGNGASLRCSYACLRTQITLQDHEFTIDFFILQVEGPDVILGVQWLQELGDVTKNYRDLTMKFDGEQGPVFLQGEGAELRQISYNSLFSLIGHEPEAEVFEIIPVVEEPTLTDATTPPINPRLQSVLEKFVTVFDIPTGLPPPRKWDHKIHLPPGSKPVNVRPYRYPYFQKSEIERQVKEMSTQGVIRHSTSPFSSPVLLVRKKDGTFRFCVDYRALNATTTADNFPIPTADELFDELNAARVFSKLDLRSGYHQIRMHAGDVHKTAFRTHEGHYEFLVMPFGLTNAPSTFQAAMNSIFQPFLRQFVIVFFDDILIYNNSLLEHAEHLEQVLRILHVNFFYVKRSKCSFGVTTIDYLGHIISAGELKADPAKIESMMAWPVPSTVKHLRGFLGLTGYYRRFVKDYSIIAAPLTDLLKKEAFKWNEAAEAAFNKLKMAMSATPVLHLPNFDIPFVIETDASDFGVGAVLLQHGHPLAYFSKKLGPRRRLASTYHKELYAIVEAVQKWQQYLLGREFIIRSDQRSLKDLLSQIVQTPDQQFYIQKLMGFKFTIEYKSGASNKVADALSRRDPDPVDSDSTLLIAYARPTPRLLELIRSENATLPELVRLHQDVHNSCAPAHFSIADGCLYFKRRLVIDRQSAARAAILEEAHGAKTAGHPGDMRTFTRVATSFYWPGMRRDVRAYMAACSICQATKYITQKPAGLIQPLPIPDSVWSAASMDFIVGLPPSHGFTAIMVVVDRLSKYAHFGALPTGFDAPRVARLFIDTVVKLHGFPEKLLSDRDTIFMSEFWTELLTNSGTKLQFTTAYHPQTDGQTEVTNRALEQYLRAFTFEQPKKWFQFLPWAELAMNTNVNVSIGMSPFKALYGRDPPNIFSTPARPSRNVDVADLLVERTDLLRFLKERLSKAQQLMAETANRHRRHVEFNVGDKVLLRLQPYRQVSVGRPISAKLGRRYYGPFEITERIGKVAYRLQLPADSKIHDVFHVSLLKPFVPPLSETALDNLPSNFEKVRPIDIPIKATEERVVLQNNIPQTQWRVSWSSHPSDSTWEPRDALLQHFPTLCLEDKSVAKEGGDDRVSNNEPPTSPIPTEPAPASNQTVAVTQPVPTEENPGGAAIKQGNKAVKTAGCPKRATKRPARYQDFSSK
ncbi:hypothetical protein AAHA92_23444 [Salvia divinorum]|uniref:Ty3/gypsy retrotransposon protein n=1 Tax=Salvia divinorum TaxID=28513 RepID=A0ABD1GV46_SALDI